MSVLLRASSLGPSRWAVDGNYSAVRDIVWGRADTLVWLDYPFPVVMRQLTRRTLKRGLGRENALERQQRSDCGRSSPVGTRFFCGALRTHWAQRKK